VLGVATYGPTLRAGWVVAPPDDQRWLAMVRDALPADVPSWFVRQPAFFYRPLTRVSFYLDHLVWDDNPFGFRLTNLALYIAAAAALGWLVYEATRAGCARAGPAAFFAATLYEVYPGNWEAAYWISARADILAALFVLAALALLLRARREWRISCWLGAMACAAAAMFSKESGLALLPIVAVWSPLTSPRLRQSGRHWRWAAITLLALLALAAGYWHLRSIATAMGSQHAAHLARWPALLPKALRWGGSWWYRPLVLQSYYIVHWAVPGVMTLLVAPLAFIRFWGARVVWVGALALVLRRAPRPALIFIPFHALALLPALGEAVVVPFRRFFYLPGAGDQALTALVCWALLTWTRRRWGRWGWAAVAVYVALLIAFAHGAAAATAGFGSRLFGR
jgi:hypothetical protein